MRSKGYIAVIAVMVALVGAFVLAQSDLLTADYSAAGWSKYYKRSLSVGLPEGDKLKQTGTGIYIYSYDRTDTVGRTLSTVAAHKTELDLPDNAIIRDAWVEVLTPVLPTNATVALGFNSAGDILAATTNLSVAGNYQCIPDLATIGDAVKLTADRNLDITIGTAATTQGVFKLYVDYVQGM